jgi:adenosylcobyric acid synthase
MVQGTASGVGKSMLTAALCRLFARAGYRVAPFKSQNMALNAAVTADGGEIGRAQAAQAAAAGIEPTVDMNPILLKPESDMTSQVVVRGRVRGRATFAEYRGWRQELLPVVSESLARLRAAHEVVVIEGAGSPAEINLTGDEIVNMTVARLADAPVLLVGDIDRGGVFAALVGTLTLLPPADRARIAGFVINRFRGDLAVLQPGIEELARRARVPVLGVVPYVPERLLPAEDSLDLDDAGLGAPPGDARLEIAVVRLPRIANFDDFEPLAAEPDVRVRFVRDPLALADADAVVVPGSKSTMADLAWLRARGFADAIRAAARRGGVVVGVCGGYQMLGRTLSDPDGVESAVALTRGLDLLPVATTFAADKRTVRVRARVGAGGPFGAASGVVVAAYEIHCGRTEPLAPVDPAFTILDAAGVGVDDGAVAGNVVGTYLHGVLADDELRGAFLTSLAARRGVTPHPAWGTRQPAGHRYDRLADLVGSVLDLGAIGRLVGLDLSQGTPSANDVARSFTGTVPPSVAPPAKER